MTASDVNEQISLLKNSGKVPKHIGVILDGNRRFSKKLMLKPWMGHEWGAKKVEDLLTWAKELDIKELTLYTFSIENFNRPKEEFKFLMELFLKEFKRIKEEKKYVKEGLRINFIGRITMFPKEIQEVMKNLMEETKENNVYTVNFAMAYGGRTEVVDAVRKIAQKVKEGNLSIDEINEESFAKELYMKDEPDLIIRTGGDRRTSNFLIWQGNYAELMFVEKFWPEFDKETFLHCINEFTKRERRFGK